MGIPPPRELSASGHPRRYRIAERTWIDPLHAIGICIVAANAETVGSDYIAAVQPSNIASRMQVIAAHARVCDDCV